MYFDAAVLVKKSKVDIMKLSLPKLKYGQSLIKILYTLLLTLSFLGFKM